MEPCYVVEVCGLEPERDETRHEFSSHEDLRMFIRKTSLAFADHLAELKHECPEHELNTLGPEYMGVGYGLTIQRSNGEELGVGVAASNWALIPHTDAEVPSYDVSGPGRLIFFLGDWTELDACTTYQPATAWRHVTDWLLSGRLA